MIRYTGPFGLLASIPVFFFAFGPWGPLATIGLLLTLLLGADLVAPRANSTPSAAPALDFRALHYALVPLQLVLIAWASDAAAGTTPAGAISLALAVGITTGVFGMLSAHELAHSRSSAERMLAGVMLGGMAYRHFRIAHVHVHHRWAATERDCATARLGEGFYSFLIRTVPGQFLEAWRFERSRCDGRPIHSNRFVGDGLVFAAIILAALAFWGWRGPAFFIAQAAIAIVVLELFNYIAHYGLRRAQDLSGRFEPLSDRHSWNSSNLLVNHLVFNMGRHSYHHRRPAAAYQELRLVRGAPELPAGYAGSILLALVPPLWHRLMDPKVSAQGETRVDATRLAA